MTKPALHVRPRRSHAVWRGSPAQTWTTLQRWNEDHGLFRQAIGDETAVDLSAYKGMSNLRLRWRAYDPGTGDFDYTLGTWAPGWQIIPVDFNGDGKSDLFLYNKLTGDWYRVLLDGTDFQYTRGLWSAGWSITAADFNGDGKTDLFVYGPSGDWALATTQPDLSFAYKSGVWSLGWTIAAGG